MHTSPIEKEIVIIGGGLAGLIAGIYLAKAGRDVLIIEKSRLPKHKVCGEYISNEILPILETISFVPSSFGAPNITQLEVSSVSGQSFTTGLKCGGFGLSRYLFDYELQKIYTNFGGQIITDNKVVSINFIGNGFIVKRQKGNKITAKYVIGTFGKRSNLDKTLKRPFISNKTPYTALKFHAKTNGWPQNKVALHNFKNGYCGISGIEKNKINFCLLWKNFKPTNPKDIYTAINKRLSVNPRLADVLKNTTILFEQPLAISQVNFSKKGPLHNHILMAGDTAGLIAPFAGNGMAIAIKSGYKLAELINKQKQYGWKRQKLELNYSNWWQQEFSYRLNFGRLMHPLFGNAVLSNLTINLANKSKYIQQKLIKQTHGKVATVAP